MQMVESRRAERARTFLRARIVFNNQNSTIDCTVKNISSSGAKIELSDAVALPEVFDLLIPQKGRTYRVRISWRDAESIGVRFVADDNETDLHEGRTKRLEQDNERLRAQVVALTKQLADLGQAIGPVF